MVVEPYVLRIQTTLFAQRNYPKCAHCIAHLWTTVAFTWA